MNPTELETAQAALAANVRESKTICTKQREIEQSIAASQAKLTDLEQGIGAPDRVSEWLKLKTEIARSIDDARAELALNQDALNTLGRAQPALIGAVKAELRREMISYCPRAKLNDALAQATRYATEICGLDTYFRTQARVFGISDAESIALHRLANELIADLPGAVRELGITQAMVDSSRARWAALENRIMYPEDTTSTAAAAE